MKLKDENKRVKIIKSTIDIVAKYGILGLKIAEIAKKTKISQSNVYIYFKNKEDLLVNVFLYISEKYYKKYLYSKNKDLPYKLRMREYFLGILNSKIKFSKELTYIKTFVVSPYFNENLKEKFEESYSVLIDFIIEGQTNMILKNNVNNYLILASLDGITDKILEYKAKNAIQISEDLIESAFEIFWDSVKQ